MSNAESNPTLAKNPPVFGAREEERLVSGERLRLIGLGAITVIFIVLCAMLAVPFLPALTWGIALAIVAWPLHVWVSRHVSWHGAAAAITLTAVLLVIVVPGLFVAVQLVTEASSAADKMQSQEAEGTLRAAMMKVEPLRPAVEWMDRMNFDVDESLRNGIRSIFGDVNRLVHGSVAALIQFALALFILFHLLRDRPAIMQAVRGLLPLSRGEADRVFNRVSESVHGTVNGQVVTSVIDGVTGGLLFWAVGVPSPVLWGVVMTVLSVLPALGTFLVWAPAATYLALAGNVVGAVLVVGWGVATAIFVDNILYTRLAGERMRLHPVPTLLAFLGGLAIFGMSGIIIGPVIAVTTIALLEVWGRRSTEQTTDTLVKRLESAADEPHEQMAESDAKAGLPPSEDLVQQRMEQAAEDANASMPRDEAAETPGGKPRQGGRPRSKR